MSRSNNPPPAFVRIGPNTSFYRPPPQPSTLDSSSPIDLLIICTWMGAQTKHITKYTTHYGKILPPTTSILLVESPMLDLTLRPLWLQRRRLSAACDVILSFLSSPSAGKVLLHVFSNGGAHTAVQLAYVLRQARGDLTPVLPLRGLIMDSCPGRGSFWRTLAAMKQAVPKRPVWTRWIGVLLVHIVLVVLLMHRIVTGSGGLVQHVREGLLEDGLLGGKGLKRLYLYSKADAMINWEDVKDHAALARGVEGAGDVKEVLFEKSPHVGHILEDKDRYWEAVTEMWTSARV